MNKLVVSCMVVAAIGIVTPAAAQEPGSRTTREFVQAAGHSDAFEMLESHTVLAQSTDPRIRAYAQMMIRDHGQTSTALQQATTQSGLKPPPQGLGADQAPLLASLQSLRGQEFDQAFARQQVLAHRSALVVEQNYASTGDDPAVRQVAVAAVQVVSAHLAAAEKMQAEFAAP